MSQEITLQQAAERATKSKLFAHWQRITLA